MVGKFWQWSLGDVVYASAIDSWDTEKGEEGVGGGQTKLNSMCLPGFRVL